MLHDFGKVMEPGDLILPRTGGVQLLVGELSSQITGSILM